MTKRSELFTTIIILLMLSLSALQSWADTNVGGYIRADTTWTADGNNYIMFRSVIVEEGVTLTIEPGVVVKAAGQYALQVEGCLVARGTESEPIIFTHETEQTPGSWGFIKFEDSSVDAEIDENDDYISGCILEHCEIMYAGNGASGTVWADLATP